MYVEDLIVIEQAEVVYLQQRIQLLLLPESLSQINLGKQYNLILFSE